MERIRELVETVIMTGYLQKVDPVSLALVASPESGKTSVVLEKKCEAVHVLTDTTARGLLKVCQSDQNARFIVINDLMAISGKKSHVMQGTIAMLSAITEEGLMEVADPSGLQQFSNGKRGVIVCMTPVMMRDGRRWWNQTGFTSRLLPFCYAHSDELKVKINVAIENGQFDAHWSKERKDVFMVPKLPIAVRLLPQHAKIINSLAARRARKLGEEGYRRHQQYRTLCRAHAARRSWKNRETAKVDVDFVMWMDQFISHGIGKKI